VQQSLRISAEIEARHCRDLTSALATPTERAFVLKISKAFEELAEYERRLQHSADPCISGRGTDNGSTLQSRQY
jgi:hypothetical protein